jgi:hypothetical protein
VLKRLLDNARVPLQTKYGFIDYFTRFQPGFAYAAGADISQGVSRDYQTLVILGKKGLSIEDVAYIHINDLKAKSFAFYIKELGRNITILWLPVRPTQWGYPLCRNCRTGLSQSLLP